MCADDSIAVELLQRFSSMGCFIAYASFMRRFLVLFTRQQDAQSNKEREAATHKEAASVSMTVTVVRNASRAKVKMYFFTILALHIL